MLLSLNPVWNIGLFNLAEQSNKPIVEITSQVPIIWDKQGASKFIVDLHLESQINSTGELRLIVAAINGQLNFDAVKIKVIKKPDKIQLNTKDNFYTGFFREPNIILTQLPQHWQFRVNLPPGSNQPKMVLQLFAIFTSQTAKSRSWIIITE